ncbi:hypothetical protein PGTUg99_036468 [Puccinia graminis f. sp. tritici]|uniref:Uncharacterized protein n=1 Tax=Puccinia graminis f. sp. tritici TaxID=56615 RepID=A0A5B0RB64_PUCGR|nr:hypothetical protein PGTUg99_036468 [Puccinia graminis f. sp. tritici]
MLHAIIALNSLQPASFFLLRTWGLLATNLLLTQQAFQAIKRPCRYKYQQLNDLFPAKTIDTLFIQPFLPLPASASNHYITSSQHLTMKSVPAILAISILMLLTSALIHVAEGHRSCLTASDQAYCIRPMTGVPKIPKVTKQPDGGYPTFSCPTDMMALCCPSIPPDLKQCNAAPNI